PCHHPAPPPRITLLALHHALPTSNSHQPFLARGWRCSGRCADRGYRNRGGWALPRSDRYKSPCSTQFTIIPETPLRGCDGYSATDRKSTRLNSSHEWFLYAIFCFV